MREDSKVIYIKRAECIEKVIYLGMSVFMLLLPVITFVTYKLDEWNCMIWQYGTVLSFGVFCLICSVLNIIVGRVRYKLRTVDVLLLVLLIFGIISTIFSQDVKNSILGTENREEGLLMLISYYAVFWAATLISNEKYKFNILVMFFIRGVVEAIIAYLQVYRVIPSAAMGMFFNFRKMGVGFAAHPNYYGTVACIFCALAIGFFLFSKTKVQKIVWLILSSLFFGAVICSYARNAFLGIVCGIIFAIAAELILRYRKSRNKTELIVFSKKAAALAVCLGCVFSIFYFTTDLIKNRIEITKDELSAVLAVPQKFNWGIININAAESSAGEIQDTEKSKGLSDDAGSGRIYIWKRGLSALKYYWLTGVGIDNYSLAVNHPDLPPINEKYNLTKAHNEYLHIAVTEGIFAALIYIAFLFAVFIIILKKWISDNRENKYSFLIFGLSIAFFSYIAQAFFNASVINIAPFFWIICGMICSRELCVKDKKKTKAKMIKQ